MPHAIEPPQPPFPPPEPPLPPAPTPTHHTKTHSRAPIARENVRTLIVMVQSCTQYIYDLGKSRECFTTNAWHAHGKPCTHIGHFYPELAKVGKYSLPATTHARRACLPSRRRCATFRRLCRTPLQARRTTPRGGPHGVNPMDAFRSHE